MATPSGTTALLRAYLRPHARGFAALTGALVVGTALPLAGPQLLRSFVDRAAAGDPTSTLVRIALAYLAVALAAQAVQIATTWWGGRLAWRVTNRLREDLTEHVLGLDLSFHGRHTPGELIERIDGDVTALGEFLSRFALHVVGGMLLLAGTVVLVWREHVLVGASLTAFLAVAGVTVARLQRLTVPAATADREAVAQLFGNIEERLGAAEDIRALGAGTHAVNRYHEAVADVYRAHVRWQIVSGGMLAATNVIFALGTALLLGLGIYLLSRGTATLGTVLLLFQYSTMVHRPLEQIVGRFKELQEALAGAVRVRQHLDERPAITDPPGGGTDLPAGGPLAVRFDGVTFAYPADPAVLHDVTLELTPGRSLGLVGRTGSGKTTIARLLLRLYDPTSGAVVVGGTDLRAASLGSVRARVRAVTQDVQLFAADLRDNVTLFSDTVDDDRIEAALHEVGLGPWLEALPSGLDTAIGPGGAGLSAGEAQLLAFARVLLADPGLVILDEATSRLDPATEALVDRAVTRLLRGRTAVVIAHRLASLDRVDEIAVLEHGHVVEHGSREALAADPSSRFAHLLAVTAGRAS